MNSVLLIVLGWLLGLLAPAIVERIRKGHRSAELMRAIVSDLQELRYQMVCVSYLVRVRNGTLSKDWFDWFAPIALGYSGPNKVVLPSFLLDGENFSDAQWRKLPPLDADRGLALKQFSASLLAAHITELSILPIEFQVPLLHVRSKLELFNQHVVHLQRQFDLTFSVSGDTNRTALRANLEDGYKEIGEMAKRVADAVSNVRGLDLANKSG